MRLEHTCTVDGTYKGGGGLISRWAFGKWMGLCPRGLKLGGFKVGFYGRILDTGMVLIKKTSTGFSNFLFIL